MSAIDPKSVVYESQYAPVSLSKEGMSTIMIALLCYFEVNKDIEHRKKTRRAFNEITHELCAESNVYHVAKMFVNRMDRIDPESKL